MRATGALAALALAGLACPAVAGPPYLTDDPVPTDPGRWEIYGFTAGEGRGSALDQDVGVDMNYGAGGGIQLTATLPMSFSREPERGWRAGAGDVELGVKYRFFRDARRGLSAAVFPRAILPTSSLASDQKTRLLLPLWLGKDFTNGTSLFGGGGYEVNPGPGNHDFWLAAVALTHDLSDRLSVGVEAARQGPDVAGGIVKTRLGLGAILHLPGPYSLLISGGPTWADHQTSYRFYAALGLNFCAC